MADMGMTCYNLNIEHKSKEIKFTGIEEILDATHDHI